jgi:salicylate hydroxylase
MGLDGQEIVVIGAGIGGLAAATALAQRWARVTVLEQAAALTEVGAGIQVGPNGVAVLEALGLRDAAELVAERPEGIELRDFREGGRTIARIPLGRACEARYGRPYWQFHRADLLDVLAAGAREAGVTLRLGAPVERVTPGAGGCRVETADGTAAEAALVIAADGLRSPMRAAHFGGDTPRFTGHVAWRGLVRTSRMSRGLFPDATCVTMGPGRHLVTYPLRGGALMNFVAIEAREAWAAEGWTMPDTPENLRSAFRGWGGAAGALLAVVEETYLWGLHDHPPLPAWTAGRVALLGDACHPMLPFLAQGATAALEDAWVLAAELAVADEPERGLMAYEARRKPRAERVQRAAARNGRIYHLGPGLREAAHLGLRAASAVAPGLLLGRFDWLYGADVVSAHATA